MPEDRTREFPKTIRFTNEGTYFFTVEKTVVDHRGKQVYVGRFDRKDNQFAPENCELNKSYCLKKASIEFPTSGFTAPQERHYLDFFDFEGPNIREILAKNYGTINLNNDVKNGVVTIFNNNNGDKSKLYECMIIEPLYDKFNADDFTTPAEKIDCIRQIVSGLKQLMGSDIIVNAQITAHRDLKFLNVMVEKTADGKKIIRLIDFPSIKTRFIDNPEQDTDSTSLGAFSHSNTTPDDVMTKYKVTEKNDVFVLGCMLLEIFGVCSSGDSKNPLFIMFKKLGLNISKTDDCEKFYERALSQYPYTNPGNMSWLEQVLKYFDIDFHWEAVDMLIMNNVKRLFREAIVIEPDKRISLDTFESSLIEIENIINENPDHDAKVYPKVMFLIDTRELNLNKDKYCAVIEEIMRPMWQDFEPIVIAYDWYEADRLLQPASGMLERLSSFSIHTAFDLRKTVNDLPVTPKYSFFKSGLKGCLYEVSEYMRNGEYSSDIHVFTPIPPTESNMCVFQSPVPNNVGATEIRTFRAEDIVEELGVKVYVHTFSGATEGWYTPKFFGTASYIPISEIINLGSQPVLENTDPKPQGDSDVSLADLISV